MPELPEVETIKNDLNKKILNKKIKKVDLFFKKIIKSPFKNFISTLEGNSFKKVERRGKLLVFTLAKKNEYLTIHLRMTGQLIYKNGKEIIAGGHKTKGNIVDLPNKHTHFILHFDDGSQLFFNDLRRFAIVQIVNQKKLESILNNFGKEPLGKNFSLKIFKEIVKNKKGNIKAFLLNQKHLAGIGNIYADESLFEAGISPKRKIDSLTKREIEKLYQAIRKILRKAIQYRGTTFYTYADAHGQQGNFTKFLKVYQREGKKCLRCKKGIIQKTKIAGRGTRYCPKCQK